MKFDKYTDLLDHLDKGGIFEFMVLKCMNHVDICIFRHLKGKKYTTQYLGDKREYSGQVFKSNFKYNICELFHEPFSFNIKEAVFYETEEEFITDYASHLFR